MVFLYLLIALFLVGFIEYAGHRWLLHDKSTGYGMDHLMHHKTFTKNFYGPEMLCFYDQTWVRFFMGLVWSSALMTPVAIWLSLDFAIVFVSTATLHAGLWNIVHNEMHRPTLAWWARNRYFHHMVRFHRIHHHYPRTNYGFLFAPIFDRLLGTFKCSI